MSEATHVGSGKVRDIVPGRECVALGAEQHDANGRVVVGALQGIGYRPVHRVRQRVLLLGPREDDLQDASVLPELDVLGHLHLPWLTPASRRAHHALPVGRFGRVVGDTPAARSPPSPGRVRPSGHRQPSAAALRTPTRSVGYALAAINKASPTLL